MCVPAVSRHLSPFFSALNIFTTLSSKSLITYFISGLWSNLQNILPAPTNGSTNVSISVGNIGINLLTKRLFPPILPKNGLAAPSVLSSLEI